jgi:acetate kinase
LIDIKPPRLKRHRRRPAFYDPLMPNTLAPLVLAVNAGSSTLKFALYPVHDGLADAAIASGQIDGLSGTAALPFVLNLPDGTRQRRELVRQAAEPFDDALAALRDALGELLPAGRELAAVAHRIVHGGTRCTESMLLDAPTLAYLATLNDLAPLHQPHNLRGVQAFTQAFPELPQIGCFDTSFHTSLPAVEQRLPLPVELHLQGVRRYGFHGLSYRYLVQAISRLAPELTPGRLLMAHLGSGASLAAVHGGRSVATTMGFSALDGLMMGTRSGALDPGVLLHLLRHGWDHDQLERLLYRDCGLKGVSGLSADMRTLRASSEPAAHEAIAIFTRRVLRESGALVACMGGIDGLVFTGGIGEHDVQLRQDLCSGLAYLGVVLDAAANRNASGDVPVSIHAAGSRVPVWVIPTDEGRMAAQDAERWLLEQGRG